MTAIVDRPWKPDTIQWKSPRAKEIFYSLSKGDGSIADTQTLSDLREVVQNLEESLDQHGLHIKSLLQKA